VWDQRLTSLSDADRERVWLLFDGGMNASDLAKRFGVSASTISRELQNRRQRTNVRKPAKAKTAAQPA
jgi:IS30 family transposase